MIQEASPEFKTRYRSRGCDRGRGSAIHRRQIRDAVGDEFFGDVSLNERKFEGFEFFGVKPVSWSGTPIAIVKARHGEIPAGLIYFEKDPWKWSRPSLYVYQIRDDQITEENPLDIETIFATIRQDWEEWSVLPETAKLRNWAILFTLEDGELKIFRSPK